AAALAPPAASVRIGSMLLMGLVLPARGMVMGETGALAATAPAVAATPPEAGAATFIAPAVPPLRPLLIMAAGVAPPVLGGDIPGAPLAAPFALPPQAAHQSTIANPVAMDRAALARLERASPLSGAGDFLDTWSIMTRLPVLRHRFELAGL